MNRRSFVRKLAGIGLFTILPGAGRIWKAERKFDLLPYKCKFFAVEEIGLLPQWKDMVIPIIYQRGFLCEPFEPAPKDELDKHAIPNPEYAACEPTVRPLWDDPNRYKAIQVGPVPKIPE